MTGESASQDDRIAVCFTDSPYEKPFVRTFLDTVLPSKLVAGKQASRLLREMAAKSKSPKLTEAIRSITAVGRDQETSGSGEQEKGKEG